MQYTVIFDDDKSDFIERVQSRLAEGWTLQGGVSIAELHDSGVSSGEVRTYIVYAQAMTKQEDPLDADR